MTELLLLAVLVLGAGAFALNSAWVWYRQTRADRCPDGARRDGGSSP